MPRTGPASNSPIKDVNDTGRFVFVTVQNTLSCQRSRVVGLTARGGIECRPVEDDSLLVTNRKPVDDFGVEFEQVGIAIVKAFRFHRDSRRDQCTGPAS